MKKRRNCLKNELELGAPFGFLDNRFEVEVLRFEDDAGGLFVASASKVGA